MHNDGGDGEQLEAATDGAEGALVSLRPGSTLVISSTVGPEVVRDLTARASERGVELLDAPVSGGPVRARSGELVVMAAGSDAAYERVAPLLHSLGASVVRCGEVGIGQATKLVNQLLAGIHIAAAAEALGYAQALGLDPRKVFEIVRGGAAASFMLEDRGGRMLSRSFEPAMSAVDIFNKDMGLVLETAAAAGYSPRLSAVAAELYREASDLGLSAADDSAVIDVYVRSDESHGEQR